MDRTGIFQYRGGQLWTPARWTSRRSDLGYPWKRNHELIYEIQIQTRRGYCCCSRSGGRPSDSSQSTPGPHSNLDNGVQIWYNGSQRNVELPGHVPRRGPQLSGHLFRGWQAASLPNRPINSRRTDAGASRRAPQPGRRPATFTVLFSMGTGSARKGET